MGKSDAAIKEAIERLHTAINQDYNATKIHRTIKGAENYSLLLQAIDNARDHIRKGIA